MIDSSLRLVISVIIISFIITMGFFEVREFLNNRDKQIFYSDVQALMDNIEQLRTTNSIGSFTQTNLLLPEGQMVIFNNETNNITLKGIMNNEINPGIDIISNLTLNESGNYVIILCYDCSIEKEYLVVFR